MHISYGTILKMQYIKTNSHWRLPLQIIPKGVYKCKIMMSVEKQFKPCAGTPSNLPPFCLVRFSLVAYSWNPHFQRSLRLRMENPWRTEALAEGRQQPASLYPPVLVFVFCTLDCVLLAASLTLRFPPDVNRSWDFISWHKKDLFLSGTFYSVCSRVT